MNTNITIQAIEEELVELKHAIWLFVKDFILVEASIFISVALLFAIANLWQYSLISISVMLLLMTLHYKILYCYFCSLFNLYQLRREIKILNAHKQLICKLESLAR